MATLAGQQIKNKYGNLLHVEGGLTVSPKKVEDGQGNLSGLSVLAGGVGVENLTFTTQPTTATGETSAVFVTSTGDVVKQTLATSAFDAPNIIAGTGISVSGTYPNITIDSTSSYTAGAGILINSGVIQNGIIFEEPVSGDWSSIRTDSKIYFAAGDGVDIDVNGASGTITWSSTGVFEETFVATTAGAATLGAGSQAVLSYSAANNTTDNTSFHFGVSPAKLSLDATAGEYIENVSGSAFPVMIDITATLEVSSPNSDITYTLQKWNGTAWTNVKSIIRYKASTGNQVDSFWGMFMLGASERIRINVYSSTGNISVSAYTQVRFVVKETGNII